ncbi:FKBP-type peptidylprolyl isomerase [Flammeovirgaceae bacterium 311]|nr:FKBP-type peptidylprolyl isomerase [Flammeovirgaceae bacterium 311]
MVVADKMVVSIRYTMKNERGEVLESIMESAPVTYLHGAGNILPSLEANLAGLRVGEGKTFRISDGQQTAIADNDYSMQVIVDDVRFPTDEELLHGQPGQKDKDNCEPGCCC